MSAFEGRIGSLADMMGIGERSDDVFGESRQPVRAEELAHRASDISGGTVNCYPGTPGAGCYDTAYFFSLKDRRYAAGRGHLTLDEALRALMEHFTVHCPGHTRNAIVVVDNWDPKVFRAWEPSVRMIAKTANLECYLIAADTIVRIPI